MLNIGVISCVHGFDGAVVLRTYVSVKKLPEFIFIEIDGTFVPYQIVKSFSKGENYVIIFDNISDRVDAAEIIKRKVFIDERESEEYVEVKSVEIKGFEIIDKNFGHLGFVEGVDNYPAHDCIVGKKNLSDENTFLIPYVDELILQIDVEKKIVETDIPEGLV